ncbi:hypothetical protein [Noviherbaspirillum sedimenti]|uniref:hypothetical protein n=1 Tax=Noviherbaspirillum sedimenti TaxID=2320865 RepID=UPI001F2C4600
MITACSLGLAVDGIKHKLKGQGLLATVQDRLARHEKTRDTELAASAIENDLDCHNALTD